MKTKECTKKDISKNRQQKTERYKEYDRKRAYLPKRVKARADYYEKIKDDPDYKARMAESRKRDKEKNPDKILARIKISRAVYSHKIKKPKVCSLCGNEGQIEGHHYDYSKPLDVLWVCHTCHGKIHKELRRLERQGRNDEL